MIIVPDPMAYQAKNFKCRAKHQSHTSLQSAWDQCSTQQYCEGVFKEGCSGNTFFTCSDMEQGPPSKGFNGCMYIKP